MRGLGAAARLLALSGPLLALGACAKQTPALSTQATPARESTAASGEAQPRAASAAAQRPAANAEACRSSCNGEFAPHGLAGVSSCLCRTHDFHKACEDGDDCEGECVLDPVKTRVEVAGPPARGFFVGQCSEFVRTFGCLRRLPRGQKHHGALDLSELPPEICID